ncbi:hypothetical protein IXO159_17715 [Xanthomonas oryzae pv. oryzae]|uniref:Uncharacterized protein n=1 Tax=Xanthomonas oryzae pv. oryzae TaxID=64187 RepID=A0A854CNA9_XANOO|nr:hypothetical protein BXO439_19170 [Xanthomonas oryzae pv. oryzae]OLG99872.1 hypothetical protein BXO582_14360 [Xanthomonas oryzae pv. oryzae]OLH27158.1 hypothetical protein DXO27_18360 [Xanthomonas oryzae pv. oryzae]OLH30016.1 hypothetical protein DXO044_01695 [Xanthomonas oryzae pv. oryzae]OLH78079.1 hypothetical protein DXO165_15480 [Xanthomonas oryzae pv. oryzae]
MTSMTTAGARSIARNVGFSGAMRRYSLLLRIELVLAKGAGATVWSGSRIVAVLECSLSRAVCVGTRAGFAASQLILLRY